MKYKCLCTLFSDANVANAVLLRIICSEIRTLFSDANVSNTVFLCIICAADLSPAFLFYAKRPPRDVIFSLSLDCSWAWLCNSCLASLISTLSRLRLCSDAACLLRDKYSSRSNYIVVLSLLAAR